MTGFIHETLRSGIEYAVLPLPRRHVVSFQIRILAGACHDPADKLGLARLVAETIDKGTAERTGRELADAFDAIGAGHRIGAGRETFTATCTVLPRHFERALALHAEFLKSPAFPDDAFAVNLELARQELIAMEDDTHALTDKLISRKAFGPILGRHPLGESDTLDRISRDDLHSYWRTYFHAGRMLVGVAGAIEPQRVAAALHDHFADLGSSERAGRDVFPVTFSAGSTHLDKTLEQEQIAICFPGVDATHEEFPTQQAMLGILAGGMSARLFTEVREKQGLVYWVSAWQDTPRGSGLIFLGASTTPERSEQTYATLLREVDRLAEDIAEDELHRAQTGLLAHLETRGDGTRARCGELLTDLFFFGRPLSDDEKIAKIQSVSIDGIRRYLGRHPRDELCVVTVGPKALRNAAGAGATVSA